MPAIACLVCLEFLWPFSGSGPMFTSYANTIHKNCKAHWLSNLLFINNWNNAIENCVNHTFYSSIDMQLFAIGAVVIYIMQRRRLVGFFLCGLLILADFG